MNYNYKYKLVSKVKKVINNKYSDGIKIMELLFKESQSPAVLLEYDNKLEGYYTIVFKK